jgi:hypothetical protein
VGSHSSFELLYDFKWNSSISRFSFGSLNSSSSEGSCPGDWLCSGMSDRCSSSEDDSSLDSPLSSDSSVISESGSRCYSSLGDGLGIWLPPEVVLVEGHLTKRPLLSFPGSEMVAVVPGDFLG